MQLNCSDKQLVIVICLYMLRLILFQRRRGLHRQAICNLRKHWYIFGLAPPCNSPGVR